MTSSLVGSEMCIRDRSRRDELNCQDGPQQGPCYEHAPGHGAKQAVHHRSCLLYTSDAADDM
eukprot:4658449-Prorocentrum_lima.AAC.1